MQTIELLDPDEARRFLFQGLWLQRIGPVTKDIVKPALGWLMDIASAGHALPPSGFVADLGQLIFASETIGPAQRDYPTLTHWPAGLTRAYEDYVLGRFYTDATFERAATAVRRYKIERDRTRGLTFIVSQFRERANYDGVMLTPGVIRSALEAPPEETLKRGWESLESEGLMPLLQQTLQSLITATRRTAELLSSVDLFELEHGTALADLGQRVALRQVLQTVEQFQRALPLYKVKPLSGRQEVPTRVLDEDTYPVGGFVSISTRGSPESLLHSQLAYLEPNEPVDLFTVKYLRDELYYYSRDENQFLRRRRAFVFALDPSLVQARFKDRELPVQRIVLVLALIVTMINKLIDWLSADALKFHIVLLQAEDTSPSPLTHERELLEMILREQLTNGTVVLHQANLAALTGLCAAQTRRSSCQLLYVAANDQVRPEPEDTLVTRLQVDGPAPLVGVGTHSASALEAPEPLAGWIATLEHLLQLWI